MLHVIPISWQKMTVLNTAIRIVRVHTHTAKDPKRKSLVPLPGLC